MELFTYDVTTKKKLYIGRQYDHNATVIQFSGFEVETPSDAVYLKLDNPVNAMIPLTSDLKFTVQSNVTAEVGLIRAQITEFRPSEDDVDEYELIKGSPVFYCMVAQSIATTEIAEITDPTLDLVYAEMKAKYELLVSHEETAASAAEQAKEFLAEIEKIVADFKIYIEQLKQERGE